MERTKVETPLACYGLEYEKSDPLCQGCPHKTDCHKTLGFRKDRVKIDRLKFDLLPDSLQAKLPEPKEDDLLILYQQCYRSVFKKDPDHTGHKLLNSAESLRTSIQEAGCTTKLFMLAVMTAHQVASPDLPFWPTMLLGSAGKRVDRYRKVCSERYGTFDLAALSQLTDQTFDDVELKLLNSEIIVGSWIVGYKAKNAGLPLDLMYNQQELTLSPYWLAVEPSYLPLLEGRQLSKAQQQHVQTTVDFLRRLKKRPNEARQLFQARAKIVPRAISHVLGLRRLEPSGFESLDVVQKDAIKFWSRLGLAVQHLGCIRFLEGTDVSGI